MPEIADLTIETLGRAFRARSLSPTEVVQTFLHRIAADECGAFVTIDADGAMAAARSAEAEIARGEWRGPLHGVPLALKDLVRTRGLPTTGGSPVFPRRRDDDDAQVVRRLKAAGAILLGKLRMTEAAFFAHHASVTPPCNPRGRGHWTGASSSGPAVAVAAGLCAGAIGSDTGGSIRIPAACCGITGLKPTRGRVDPRGSIALARTLDHLGPMARCATDVAAIFATIADDADTTEANNPRVGIDAGFATRDVDADVCEAFAATRTALAAAGIASRAIAFPSCDAAMAAWSTICAHEAWLAHRDLYAARRADYGPALAAFLETGRDIDADALAEARVAGTAFAARLDAVLGEVEMILLPVLPIIVPTLDALGAMIDAGALARLNHFTQVFNLSGHPAIAFPAGVSAEGLPIGMQLVGRRGADLSLCRVVRAFQQVSEWHLHRDG